MAKWEYKSLEFFIEKVGRGYFDTTRLNLTKFDQEINQMGEEGKITNEPLNSLITGRASSGNRKSLPLSSCP